MVEIETISGTPRVSVHINRKPAGNIHHAIRLAEHLGVPLNTFVTINYALTSCQPEHVSRSFETLRRNYFTPWLRRPPARLKVAASPSAYIWVLEAAGGNVALHWLINIPPKRAADFASRLFDWLAAVGAIVSAPCAVQIKSAPRPRGLGRYLLKGIDPVYAPFYGVNPVPQGKVSGRRSGFSRCLGPSVRARLIATGEIVRQRRFYKWPGA
jgi:hypothetical protein